MLSCVLHGRCCREQAPRINRKESRYGRQRDMIEFIGRIDSLYHCSIKKNERHCVALVLLTRKRGGGEGGGGGSRGFN